MRTEDLLKKVRRLEIKTKGLTKHLFSGEYHSSFKGRGMAFSEVRDYHFGDDVRNIDWNVTARFREPYVKVFEEERELTLMLIVDLSGSTDYGTGEQTKRDLAVELSAVLGFSAEANNDKVGAIFVTDRVERFIPPMKGRKHLLYLLRELIEFQPKGSGTNLEEGLRYFRNVVRKRSIAFVISDFVQQEDSYLEALKISQRKHDVLAIRLQDASEKSLPDIGMVEMFNAETGRKTWVNTSSKKLREDFEKRQRQLEEEMENRFEKNGIDYASIETGEDYIPVLMRLFRQRK
ncbi:MAG: DUF58 domain-containing protein [Bacteroidetes bacterium]|nr:MAG: DUF58 domain-containing protein [Bacteroidota bacterium]